MAVNPSSHEPPRNGQDPPRPDVRPAPPRREVEFRPARGVLAHLPLLPVAGLFLLSFAPRFQVSGRLALATRAAGLALLALHALLWFSRRKGPALQIGTAARRQHWVQALVQLSVYAYWGWYWRPVYDFAPLLAAQILFAYGVESLLSWTRHGRWTLGFGPVPIILSINLFLWFRDDWFHLQYLMIAVGFLGKEFIRWQREGRAAHIFNPSAFTLGLFSLVLIATRTTDLTWGPEIASTLTLAPWIYLFLFGTGLVVMYFFSITLVAAFAAATLFGLSALYGAWAGVPYFVDSEIPAAVFLGLHLLITDPSTSPRTRTGKSIFGVLYGLGVFALYAILDAAGAPTFYDKLLCVPLLNLGVRGIDAFVADLRSRRLLPGPGLSRGLLRGNLAHMALWVVFFGAMAASGRTDGRHRGDPLPFWEQACSEGLRSACDRLMRLEATYCADASAWACNELGLHYREARIVAGDEPLARGFLARSCELRYQPACLNLLDDRSRERGPPRLLDLRLLLREGGRNLMDFSEPALYRRACEHGWSFACVAEDTAG